MAKKRSKVSRKIAKITNEEKRKPRSERKPRKQIIAQGINMVKRSGRRGA